MAVPHPCRPGGHFAGLVSGGGGLLPTPCQVVTETAALPVDTRTISRKVTFHNVPLSRQHIDIICAYSPCIAFYYYHFLNCTMLHTSSMSLRV